MIDVKNQDGQFRVVFQDGTVLFETKDRTRAHARAAVLSEIADRRQGKATAEELLVLFPPTAPAPLVMTSLSIGAGLAREDVWHEASGTWSMRNVEVLREGLALKQGADGKWRTIPFTADDVMAFVEAFAVVGWQPPAKITHAADQPIVLEQLPSIARTVALRAAEVKTQDGRSVLALFADLDRVPVVLRNAIGRGAFPQRSIEFWSNVPRPDGKGTLRLVLKAVSLLGEDLPAVPGMPALDIAPATFAADCTHSHATFSLETQMPPTPDPKGGEKVELTKAEYEALQTKCAKVETLEADNKAAALRLTRIEVERRVEGASTLASRIRTEGKIAPAQEATVVELLKVLDDENKAAITLSTTDGATTREEKLSARGTFVKFLESLPKNPNAPGAPGTSGGSSGGTTVLAFGALSVEEQGKHIATLGDKYLADKAKGFKSAVTAYEQARKDLVAGTVKVEGV